MARLLYSVVLGLALMVSAPWWLWRMLTQDRYREGLGERLGRMPTRLDETIAARVTAPGLVWLHAVSVGEVLAAERLVGELQAALPGWLVVVSTTTATGQAMARKRLDVPVFFYPLDFAFTVRRYLRVLRPSLFLTVESEFWPRMLVECERAGIPVAVVNARISDRSFPRYLMLLRLWRPLLRMVSLFLAQGEETAGRLHSLGVETARVQVLGNLKFDPAPAPAPRLLPLLREQIRGRPVIVAGSTVAGSPMAEEQLVLAAMETVWDVRPDTLLMMAPRHPQRFVDVAALIPDSARATALLAGKPLVAIPRQTLLLDTLGDLAALYELAGVAFVGGSLLVRGGHNPLEAARFGVPVTMGHSYENFREIVAGLLEADALRLLPTKPAEIGRVWLDLLAGGQAMGLRGRRFAESQEGATARTVTALCRLLGPQE